MPAQCEGEIAYRILFSGTEHHGQESGEQELTACFGQLVNDDEAQPELGRASLHLGHPCLRPTPTAEDRLLAAGVTARRDCTST